MGWYLKYYFATRTRRWYRSLFKPETGQIAGETTPRYAVLPERTVQQIKRLTPDFRVIYLPSTTRVIPNYPATSDNVWRP